MSLPAWTRREIEFFTGDGALRDIYVLNASITIWQRLHDHLILAGSDIQFSIDGESAPLPPALESLFAAPEGLRPLLTCTLHSVHLAVHYFSPDEFEADFWPSDVQTETAFEGLCQLLRDLSAAAGQDVLLTNENYRENPFIVYSPRHDQFILPA